MNDDVIKGIDRLAYSIIGALHKLFGFSYSRNTEHFTYQLTLDTAVDFVVGTALTGSLRISQEADFVCTRVNCESRWLAATDASAIGMQYRADITGFNVVGSFAPIDVPFDIAITDGSTDRALQNEPVSAYAAFGMHGGLPGIWSKPRLFARNSNIAVTLTMVRAAIAANADSLRNRVLFMGWKIYDSSALDLTARRP